MLHLFGLNMHTNFVSINYVLYKSPIEYKYTHTHEWFTNTTNRWITYMHIPMQWRKYVGIRRIDPCNAKILKYDLSLMDDNHFSIIYQQYIIWEFLIFFSLWENQLQSHTVTLLQAAQFIKWTIRVLESFKTKDGENISELIQLTKNLYYKNIINLKTKKN